MVTLTDTLLHPSPSSLTLITSTIGAPSTWLLNAYVAETLRPQSHVRNGNGNGNGNGAGRAVVLVSFVNDERFLREGLRRGAGVDTQQYEKMGKLKVIDGLSRLFENSYLTANTNTTTTTNPPPILGGPVPARGGPLALSPLRGIPSQLQPATSRNLPCQTPSSQVTAKLRLDVSPDGTLTSTRLKGLYTTISTALLSLTPTPTEKPLLAVDSPDLLLATTSLPAHSLWDFLLDLRELSHNLLLTLNADTPLLTPAISLATSLFHNQAPPPLGTGAHTRLETESAVFITMAVHNAEWVVGLRLLDTGVAKDVSGVMRITRGGAWEELEGDGEREKEVLYFVGEGGGGVEIFDRGEVRG
ncbi:hypothetical protein BGX38DRAFT_1275246 [Terfezia claveryi]|nr:hypothetical protein BGX38DRAFT_1275246 [Terfezia claveryi]